jgi:hypothetical protein
MTHHNVCLLPEAARTVTSKADTGEQGGCAGKKKAQQVKPVCLPRMPHICMVGTPSAKGNASIWAAACGDSMHAALKADRHRHTNQHILLCTQTPCTQTPCWITGPATGVLCATTAHDTHTIHTRTAHSTAFQAYTHAWWSSYAGFGAVTAAPANAPANEKTAWQHLVTTGL